MQLNSIVSIPINPLANLISEDGEYPQDIIKKILLNLDFSSLMQLNTTTKSWNYQTRYLIPGLQQLRDLPRWIGFEQPCGESVLDVYKVNEDKQESMLRIVGQVLNLDPDQMSSDEYEKCIKVPCLFARVQALDGKLNYHISWQVEARIHENSLQLGKITHQSSGTIIDLKNFKNQELKETTLDSSSLVKFNLIFDSVSKYNQLIGYNRIGKNVTILRLKSIGIVAAGEKQLNEIAKLFNQFCQQLNDKEDEQYFASLDDKEDEQYFASLDADPIDNFS